MPMKKLLAMAALLAAFFTRAVAADHYIYFDGSLGAPYVWAWNSSANCCANGSWPGDKMQKAADGKWYWELPAGKSLPTQVIISNNGGEKIGGGDLDYRDRATYHQDGTYTAYVAPVNPDYEPITIYYDNSATKWASVNIHYWDTPATEWPGTPMELVDAEKKIYKYTFEEDPASLTGFLFCRPNVSNGVGQSNGLMKVPVDSHIYKCSNENKGSITDLGIYDPDNHNPDPDPEPDPTLPDVFKQYSTVLHVKDSSWGTPNIYAWVEGGAILSKTWPGTAMTPIEGYDGYYGWANTKGTTPTSLIFNYQGDTHKTENLDWVEGKVWVLNSTTSIDSEGIYIPDVVVNPDPDPDPDPDPATVTIYYDNSSTHWASVNIHYWPTPTTSWPGTPMELVDAEKNVYKYVFTQSVDGITGFLFCHPSSATAADAQSANLNTKPLDGHIYACGGNKASVEDLGVYDPDNYNPNPTPDPDPDIPEAFTHYSTVLHLQASGWGTPNIYAWVEGGSSVTTAWPGTAMTPIEGHPGYYGWRNISGQEPTNLIFNTGDNGSTQTTDLVWENGKVWVLKSAASVTAEGYYTPSEIVPEPSAYVGAIVNVEATEHGAKITSAKGYTLLTLYGDGAVKVFQVLNTETGTERHSISVSGEPAGSFTINETEDAYEFSTSQLTVTAYKSNTGLTFANLRETVLVQDNNYNRSGNVYQSFIAPGTLSFYGAGYVADSNVAGKTIYMNHTQTGGWPTSNSSYNHNVSNPMVVSPKGFGLYFDDHYLGSSLSPAVGSVSYKSASTSPVSYFFLSGGEDSDMDGVMENYTAVTGRQGLPPFWTMGYITSRFGYKTRDESENVIKNIRGVDIPLDGIVLDIYWQGAPIGDAFAQAMGRLKWDEVNFPNPHQMVDNFLNGFTKDGVQVKGGVNTILITEPYFSYKGGNENCMEMRNKGYLFAEDCPNMAWIGNGALIDPTVPAALEWMNSKVYTNPEFDNIAGWWFDLGEPEHFLDVPSNANVLHKNGETHARIHNEFGNLWVEGAHKGMVETYPERRHMIMPRSGTSGLQRFSTFPWTGDICRSWEGLEVQIPALLSSGMAGMAYLGSDIGGFQNASGSGNIPEMYLRWVQFGAFSPQLRTHTDVPWHPQNVAEPYEAAYAGVLNEVRDAIRLRYKLLPYAYTMAYENATKGSPLARPMAYYDPENAALHSCKDQYYWGRDILVAPVVKPKNGDINWGGSSTSRSITFPEAGQVWIDLNSGNNFRAYQGGSTVNYSAPLSVIPHFARYGSIIPTYDASACTSTSDIDRDNIIMNAYIKGLDGETASGYIFDDDHASATSLSSGRYNLLNVQVETHADGDLYLFIESPHHGYVPSAAARAKAASPSTAAAQSLTINLPMLTMDLPSKMESSDGAEAVVHTNREDFDNAPVQEGKISVYQDPVTKAASIKLPISRTEAPNQSFYIVNNIITGADDAIIPASALMASAYPTADGVAVRASLPAECTSARIELFDMMGALVGTASVHADGNAAFAEFSVPAGAYVARVSVDTLSGMGVATAKVIR